MCLMSMDGLGAVEGRAVYPAGEVEKARRLSLKL